MRIAVTGASGFVGIHLSRELAEHGHDVVGLGKGPAAAALAPWVTRFVEHDLSRGWPAADVGEVDALVHLAGLSAVGPSFADPQGYLHGNSAPVTHLAEHLVDVASTARVLVVSTGAVYAPGVGITESHPTQPSSPYAVSKLLVETQSAYYRRRGLDVVVMRPFNHIGPGQQPGFLLPDLARGVAAGRLTVGDLDTRRDYTDVRDVARAYRLAVEAPGTLPEVLNVCSGASVSGHELLGLIADCSGVDTPHVVVDPARLRPDDPREISGDHELISRTLGWRPQVATVDTVRDYLQDQRAT